MKLTSTGLAHIGLRVTNLARARQSECREPAGPDRGNHDTWGYEQFFEELAQLPPGPPDRRKFQEIFEKYDQETVELPPAQ